MAAGFRVRRVRSDQSIGDRLKRARIRKKITVAEVEEATKIRSKFILALESDSWEQIPSEVYGRGYLERYCGFLKLPTDEIMQQYDRERHAYARHCKESQVDFTPPNRLRLPRFLLTPRFFVIGTGALAILAFTGVVYSQLHRFTSAPYLELITPVQAKTQGTEELFVSTNSVNITGRTAIGATLHINDQLVEVGEDGGFTSAIAVQKGVNAVVVKAENSKGKVTTETLSVIVK